MQEAAWSGISGERKGRLSYYLISAYLIWHWCSRRHVLGPCDAGHRRRPRRYSDRGFDDPCGDAVSVLVDSRGEAEAPV